MKKEDFLQKTIVVCFGALLCCVLWGSAFPCIKMGYELMKIEASDTAAQILYAGIRFSLAGVLGIALGSVLQKNFLYPVKGSLPKIAWLSLFQTILQYLFFYIGLAHTSGVKASIIEGMNVFVAIVIAAMIFHQEKLTWQKIAGCIVGFAGVVLVNVSGSSLEAGLAWNGEGFIFLSCVAYAFSSVVMKGYSKKYNPVMLSGYQFLFGGAVMTALGYAFGGRLTVFSPAAAGMLCWLAMVSAVAYMVWSILLKYNPISKVAVFGFMNPVCGVILSAILLREGNKIGLISILSLALVCAGIYIVNGKEKNDGKSISH